MPFPEAGVVYDYRLEDGGVSSKKNDDDEDEDETESGKTKKNKVSTTFRIHRSFRLSRISNL